MRLEPDRPVEAEVEIAMPGARLWSPEHPDLYTATVILMRGGRAADQVDQRFGMRQLTTRGNVLLLNGKPLYLRGYGDDNAPSASTPCATIP